MKVKRETWKGKQVYVARDNKGRIKSWKKVSKSKTSLRQAAEEFKTTGSFNPFIKSVIILGKSRMFEGKKIKKTISTKRTTPKNQTQIGVELAIMKRGKLIKFKGFSRKGGTVEEAEGNAIKRAVASGVLKGYDDETPRQFRRFYIGYAAV